MRQEIFFLHQNVQTGSGTHLESYSMGTGDAFPDGKAAVAWSLPLSSI